MHRQGLAALAVFCVYPTKTCGMVVELWASPIGL